MESARKLNFFPSKGSISEYYSPRMIIHQKNIDYKKHCKYSFGSYVQAHDEPNLLNTTAARTLDCIYLQYTDSHQGGHEILHLPTNRVIIRRKITELPVTNEIVKQVNHAILCTAMLASFLYFPPNYSINKSRII